MRLSYFCMGLAAVAIGLTACGGGGGTSSGPTGPTIPQAPATSAPVATPTPNYPPHPAATGETFTFSGTYSQNDTYTYPQPSPLPSTSTRATVTQKISVSATANPFGSGTADDFQTVESDAYPTQTLSTTTDTYYQDTASISQLFGYKAVDDIQDTTLYQYVTPQIIDQLPEVPGANWTNSPAAIVAEAYPSGEAAARTIDANGGYVDTERLLGTDDYPATTATLKSNDDGSAEFTIVFHESGRSTFPPDTDVYDNYILSAPRSQGAGSEEIVYSYENDEVTLPATPPPLNPTVESSFPMWFKLPLYSERDTDKGVVSIPKSCQAPAAFGTRATQLEQTITNTDVALGTTTVTTTNEYIVAGFGPVCVDVAGTINAYYDYGQDSPVAAQSPTSVTYQGARPLQTTVISELLTLASQAPYTQSTHRSTMSLTPISPVAVANARLSVARGVERDRVARVRTFLKRIYTASKGVR
jgi:hypothetical protein